MTAAQLQRTYFARLARRLAESARPRRKAPSSGSVAGSGTSATTDEFAGTACEDWWAVGKARSLLLAALKLYSVSSAGERPMQRGVQ